jgi:hypothetical protein
MKIPGQSMKTEGTSTNKSSAFSIALRMLLDNRPPPHRNKGRQSSGPLKSKQTLPLKSGG